MSFDYDKWEREFESKMLAKGRIPHSLEIRTGKYWKTVHNQGGFFKLHDGDCLIVCEYQDCEETLYPVPCFLFEASGDELGKQVAGYCLSFGWYLFYCPEHKSYLPPRQYAHMERMLNPYV